MSQQIVQPKKFNLGAVLTVTTGRLLCPIDELYQILDHMTGDQLFTHQLPRAGEECKEPLLQQHPHLRDVVVPPINSEEDCLEWLTQQSRYFGAELEVAPLNPDDHTSIDPLTELAQMTSKPIIPVIVDGGAA